MTEPSYSISNLEDPRIISMVIEAHVNALDDLPVIERLRFVKNLLCDRQGETGDAKIDAMLETAERVIEGVMAALEKNRRMAKLRDPGL